jgi:hypothetical protein
MESSKITEGVQDKSSSDSEVDAEQAAFDAEEVERRECTYSLNMCRLNGFLEREFRLKCKYYILDENGFAKAASLVKKELQLTEQLQKNLWFSMGYDHYDDEYQQFLDHKKAYTEELQKFYKIFSNDRD